MVNSVNNVDKKTSINTFSILNNVRKNLPLSTPTISQTDLITHMENARKPPSKVIQNLKKATNEQAKAFTQNASLYITVNLLYYWCNTGETTKEDDNKIKLVVKDLKKDKKNLDFFAIFTIKKAMNKYFSQLSFIKMIFLYYLFIGWLPKLYIKNSLNKILDFSRTKLKEGDNLPILGSKLLGTTNTYLANYKRTVERFRDDKKNPIGEINAFIRQEFHKKKLLGYPSIQLLHNEFAKAASREDTRPAFRIFSTQISKFQLLNFKFLKKLKIIRSCLIPITFTVGIIPYFIARMTEFIPNRIIKKVHSSIIKFFMPTVLRNTLEAVSQPGFTHAINSFLCDVIHDLLNEMNKKPEEKNIEEPPNVVNAVLNKDIKKFSELVYTLLRNEPYQTQEDLKHLQKYGSDPKSNLERLLKFITPTGYVDREIIKQVFVNALHSNIIDGFNLLFSQPEKLEEYQCKLIDLLNNVFEYVPDPKTDEGKALLEAMQEKQIRRENLVDELIIKGINLATEDKLNEITNSLSRNQKENLILAYRKIQKKSSDTLPFIAQDIEELKDSSHNIYPTSAQAKLAKEDIERTMRDIERLFILINNALPKENGPVKRQMEKDLGPFLKNEQLLKNNILQLKSLHEQKENLILIKTQIEKLKQILETNSQNSTKQKMDLIEKQLLTLNKFNKNHEFDSIILEYKKLDDQLKKIHFHDAFANKLQELLKNTFFSNNLVQNLVTAQKEYLLNTTSDKKEQNLIKARNKIQDFLKQLESLSSRKEIQEIKFAIKKILEAQNSNQLDEIHKKILSLIRKKITIHTSLHKDEKEVLPIYFAKCLDIIKKQTEAIPIIAQNMHTDLKQNIENLVTTVENMQKSLNAIYKQNSIKTLDIITITKILGSVISFGAGYLGFIGKTFSIFTGATALASTYFTPLGGSKRLINSLSIPLAKASAKNASNIIVNPTFYEGLLYSYMKQFIDYVKETKGGL